MSAAARESGLSPPTLSRRLDALEASLEGVLFQRGTTGLELTPLGMALLEDADAMSEAVDRIALTATGQAQGLAGTVRITASEIVTAYLLPDIVAEVQRLHPEIQIELDASNQTGNLLKREADIAIRMYRPTQPDVLARKLGELEIVACASDQFIEQSGEPETVEQLVDMPIIGFDRSTADTSVPAGGAVLA